MLLYRLLISLFAAAVVLRRGPSRLSVPDPQKGPHVWLHGASNGELASVRPVLERLVETRPNRRWLVTANTETGRDMVAGWNARLQSAIDAGAPAELVWNQGLYSIEGWGLPKGGPNVDAARQFLAFCARPEQQALFTDDLSYGPTNLAAYDHISEERAPVLTTAPANLDKMVLADESWWEENRAEMTERFNLWLLM